MSRFPLLELDRYTRAERLSWPEWLRAGWQDYKTCIKSLCDFIKNPRDYPEHEDFSVGTSVAMAEALVLGLSEPCGVLYHYNRSFPIGGPGAHPADIIELAVNVGLKEYADDECHFMTDEHPVADIIRNYHDKLVTQLDFPKILRITSASARVRAAALGFEIPRQFSESLANLSSRINKFIPDRLTVTEGTTRKFCHMSNAASDGLIAVLSADARVGQVQVADCLRQGGVWHGGTRHWFSIAELIQDVVYHDRNNPLQRFPWQTNDFIWRRENDQWTTPWRFPAIDSEKAKQGNGNDDDSSEEQPQEIQANGVEIQAGNTEVQPANVPMTTST